MGHHMLLQQQHKPHQNQSESETEFIIQFGTNTVIVPTSVLTFPVGLLNSITS